MGHLPVRLDNTTIGRWHDDSHVPYTKRYGRMNHTLHDAIGPMKMVSGMFLFQPERMARRLENQEPQAALNSGREQNNLQ